MNQPLSNHERPFELGLYNFVDNGSHLTTSPRHSPVEIMQNLLETIELADQVGLDVFCDWRTSSR